VVILEEGKKETPKGFFLFQGGPHETRLPKSLLILKIKSRILGSESEVLLVS
jgi:hypothetical protein